MDGVSLVLVAAGWLSGLALMWRLPRLVPAPDGDVDVDALVRATSVIVPARDEEASLPALLGSLAAQSSGPLEVVVVDDGSADSTAQLAAGAGARVVAAGEPPPGWLGKPWACQRGVDVAAGGRLVLLDADTCLAPDGLARIVATHAARTPEGLLSVQPYHDVVRPYEQLSALCNVVPVLASGMAAPGERSVSVAFGPCLATTRAALERAGGFAGVRRSVVEDVELARAYRGAGLVVRCVGGGRAVRFRMYPSGMASLVEGWTKNLAAGAGRAPALPTLGAVAWVAALAAVGWTGVAELLGWVSGGDPPSAVVVAAWVLVSGQLWWMLRRIGSFHWAGAVAFPVPLVAFIALFARSCMRRALRRPVTWRGRRIEQPAARPGTER